MEEKMDKKRYIVLLMALVLILSSCYYPMHDGKGNTIKNEKDGEKVLALMRGEVVEEEEEEKPLEKPKKAKLIVGGNILPQSPVMEASLVGDQTYDFKPIFENIKERVDQADLAIASLEGSLSGDLGAYSTVGQYNLPDEILEGLKYAGFNMINTATDRILDYGKPGFERSLDKIKEVGLDNIGSQKEKLEDSNVYKEVDGIKIAVIAASEYYSDKEDLIKSHDMEGLIDKIGDGEDLVERINRAREKSSDLIVVYLNWGEDYASKANTYQKDLAKKLAQAGADLIIGTRPHIVQEVEYLDGRDGKESLVAYSLGNTISNQRLETMSGYMDHKLAQATEIGLLLDIDIVKEEGKTRIEKVDQLPIWVDKSVDENGKTSYLIYDSLKEKDNTSLAEEKSARIKDAISFIEDLTKGRFSLGQPVEDGNTNSSLEENSVQERPVQEENPYEENLDGESDKEEVPGQEINPDGTNPPEEGQDQIEEPTSPQVEENQNEENPVQENGQGE